MNIVNALSPEFLPIINSFLAEEDFEEGRPEFRSVEVDRYGLSFQSIYELPEQEFIELEVTYTLGKLYLSISYIDSYSEGVRAEVLHEDQKLPDADAVTRELGVWLGYALALFNRAVKNYLND